MPGRVFYLVFGEKMPREIKPAKQISRLAVQHICHVIKDHFFRSEHFQHDFNGKRVAKRFRNWKTAAICKVSASALKFQCVLHSFIYEDKAGGSMPYFHSIVIASWRFIVFCFKFQLFLLFLMFYFAWQLLKMSFVFCFKFHSFNLFLMYFRRFRFNSNCFNLFSMFYFQSHFSETFFLQIPFFFTYFRCFTSIDIKN